RPTAEWSWLRSLRFLVRHVTRSFIEFAHGIQHKIGGRAQHGALRRCGPVRKLVDAFIAIPAVFQNVNYGFIAKQIAAFCVRDLSAIIEEYAVCLARVDM